MERVKSGIEGFDRYSKEIPKGRAYLLSESPAQAKPFSRFSFCFQEFKKETLPLYIHR